MNKNISPKIRFKGHIDAWEQRKFSDLVLIERGGSPRPIDDYITDAPDGLNWVKIGDAPEQGRYITKTAEKIKPEGLAKTRQVQPGDLILSNSMSFGKPYIMGINGCIHDGWLLIRDTQSRFDLKFLCHMLGTDQMLDQYRMFAAGSTVNNLNKELVGNTTVSLPSIEEQRAIGEYLESIDNLITLHQRKHIKLQNAKKSMLWKMFPHNDNEIPEVRLKGFTGAWSLRKLNTFVNYSSSNLAAKDSMNKGRYDLYDANNIIGKTDHTPMAEEYITIIKDGAGVGRIRMLPKNSMFIGTMGALTARNSNLNFVFTLLTANNLGNSFSGSTIPHIYFKDYGENAYYIPHYDEQCAIGDFFKNLDDLIESENRYINELLLMKQAFLNKMFVKVEA